VAAGATDRRNTGVESLRWGLKLQGLTGPFVELTCHFIQMGLRDLTWVSWTYFSEKLVQETQVRSIEITFGHLAPPSRVLVGVDDGPAFGLVRRCPGNLPNCWFKVDRRMKTLLRRNVTRLVHGHARHWLDPN
jgi:hypothetical protein